MRDLTIFEIEVMAHRYLYYILATPEITDQEYDELEKAREWPADSPVLQVGSDMASSYPAAVVQHALNIRRRR